MSKTTKIWSKTINKLALNVIDGLKKNVDNPFFFCPVFGTKHPLPKKALNTSTLKNLRIFEYRGYRYFIREIHGRDKKEATHYMFGLYTGKTDELTKFNMRNIMLVEAKLLTYKKFDLSNNVIKEDV